jgi:acetamidase/formamidase
VYIEGAEPREVLAVDFLRYEWDAFGTTPIIPGFGFLADLFTEPTSCVGRLRTAWPARPSCQG